MDRLFEKFQTEVPGAKCLRIRLTDPRINIESLVKTLSEQLEPVRNPVLLHIDTAGVSISSGRLLRCSNLDSIARLRFLKVCSGLEELLFHLLILGCLSDSHGKLWRRNASHLISIEVMLPQKQPNQVVLSS